MLGWLFVLISLYSVLVESPGISSHEDILEGQMLIPINIQIHIFFDPKVPHAYTIEYLAVFLFVVCFVLFSMFIKPMKMNFKQVYL